MFQIITMLKTSDWEVHASLEAARLHEITRFLLKSGLTQTEGAAKCILEYWEDLKEIMEKEAPARSKGKGRKTLKLRKARKVRSDKGKPRPKATPTPTQPPPLTGTLTGTAFGVS